MRVRGSGEVLKGGGSRGFVAGATVGGGVAIVCEVVGLVLVVAEDRC